LRPGEVALAHGRGRQCSQSFFTGFGFLSGSPVAGADTSVRPSSITTAAAPNRFVVRRPPSAVRPDFGGERGNLSLCFAVTFLRSIKHRLGVPRIRKPILYDAQNTFPVEPIAHLALVEVPSGLLSVLVGPMVGNL
jgi:hypothetical protein